MLSFNWYVILSTSIIPLVVGAVYYHHAVLGKVAARYSPSIGQRHSTKVYVFCLLLGVLLSGFMIPVVFHANHIFSIVAQPGGGPPTEGTPAYQDAMAFLEKYGNNFRSFKHGMLHGIIAAVFGIWPVLASTAFLEKKKWPYTAVHLGYWVIVFALMGGIINAYGLN
jgi:Protein of unknown function (DUF1761)